LKEDRRQTLLAPVREHLVIPSPAQAGRDHTVEAWVTQNYLCDRPQVVRSFVVCATQDDNALRYKVIEATRSLFVIDHRAAGSECDPGGTTRSVMNSGFAFVHAIASRLVSKNRSTTMALSWLAVRPHRRAALRLTTADPVSTAVQGRSGKITLLPYGIRFGSTAQCPGRNRAPVLPYVPEAPSLAQ
jgi:hypothetical protein